MELQGFGAEGLQVQGVVKGFTLRVLSSSLKTPASATGLNFILKAAGCNENPNEQI